MTVIPGPALPGSATASPFRLSPGPLKVSKRAWGATADGGSPMVVLRIRRMPGRASKPASPGISVKEEELADGVGQDARVSTERHKHGDHIAIDVHVLDALMSK